MTVPPQSGPSRARLAELAGGEPLLEITGLRAGYGGNQVLHGVDLLLGAGRSACLIGPNGAGKSTVLHAIYGFAQVLAGSVRVGGVEVTRLSPERKLRERGIAYVLQDDSVFPEMTVEENLLMGGYLLERPEQAREAAERIFQRYPRLANRRRQPARVLSGGERRLLEISRALVMEPRLLLVDEPSIGLEPRFIEMVFEVLTDLQRNQGKTVLMVEQNARKGLRFADVGYLLVAGAVVRAAPGAELLEDPEIGRLYLGARPGASAR